MAVTSGFRTVDEVARLCCVERRTIYRRIRSGELEAVRIGETGPLRIPDAAVQALLVPANRASTEA